MAASHDKGPVALLLFVDQFQQSFGNIGNLPLKLHDRLLKIGDIGLLIGQEAFEQGNGDE